MSNGITVGVKTISRPAHLDRCLESLIGIDWDRVVVVDDGPRSDDAERVYRHWEARLPLEVIRTDPDIGLAAGRNEIVRHCHSEFLLMLDDDISVSGNATLLRSVLDVDPTLGGVSAVLDNGSELRASGCSLTRTGRYVIKEMRRPPAVEETAEGVRFSRFDFIPNATLFRRTCLEDVAWDPAFKIGYEHEDFFLRHQDLGRWQFAITPDVVFRHWRSIPNPPAYNQLRTGRRLEASRRLLHEKHGIGEVVEGRKYLGTPGRASWLRSARVPLPVIGWLYAIRRRLMHLKRRSGVAVRRRGETIVQRGLVRFSDRFATRVTFYLLNMSEGRWPGLLRLRHPRTLTDKVNYLKLNMGRFIPDAHLYADKLRVRTYVADTIGEEHLVPLLGSWQESSEIPWDELPDSFVLKTNHGSGFNIIVGDREQLDVPAAADQLDTWLATRFSMYTREHHYDSIEPRILAEEYLGLSGMDPPDYKCWCFDGQCAFVSLNVDRRTDHRRQLFDRDGRPLPIVFEVPRPDEVPALPAEYTEIVQTAERLAAPFFFVRVDLYVVDGRIYFGELTFVPTGGLVPLKPLRWNRHYGKMLRLPRPDDATERRGS